jgi:hypothetical protein
MKHISNPSAVQQLFVATALVIATTLALIPVVTGLL